MMISERRFRLAVVFAAGLIVNRAQGDLFPSWSALLDQDKKAPPPTVVADPATKLDTWLRAKRNERNPGTTADLVTASLFAALREGIIPLPCPYPWSHG